MYLLYIYPIYLKSETLHNHFFYAVMLAPKYYSLINSCQSQLLKSIQISHSYFYIGTAYLFVVTTGNIYLI